MSAQQPYHPIVNAIFERAKLDVLSKEESNFVVFSKLL